MDESTFRTLSAKQAVKEVNELSQRLGAPVVFGGDFNSHLTSISYHTLKNGFNSARECCESVTNMEYRTDNLIGYSPEKGTWCIDHVFYSEEGVNAIHFETVISKLCYIYSDHVPISFDFTLS
jgi:endonuclease/exonuclease/phosphatase (EEP) superfamily protein YafD